MFVRACVCVCVCVRARAGLCVCGVCVSVGVNWLLVRLLACYNIMFWFAIAVLVSVDML